LELILQDLILKPDVFKSTIPYVYPVPPETTFVDIISPLLFAVIETFAPVPSPIIS
jgi:hypothetical protein